MLAAKAMEAAMPRPRMAKRLEGFETKVEQARRAKRFERCRSPDVNLVFYQAAIPLLRVAQGSP
jgi:hypothetical protein